VGLGKKLFELAKQHSQQFHTDFENFEEPLVVVVAFIFMAFYSSMVNLKQAYRYASAAAQIADYNRSTHDSEVASSVEYLAKHVTFQLTLFSLQMTICFPMYETHNSAPSLMKSIVIPMRFEDLGKNPLIPNRYDPLDPYFPGLSPEEILQIQPHHFLELVLYLRAILIHHFLPIGRVLEEDDIKIEYLQIPSQTTKLR